MKRASDVEAKRRRFSSPHSIVTTNFLIRIREANAVSIRKFVCSSIRNSQGFGRKRDQANQATMKQRDERL